MHTDVAVLTRWRFRRAGGLLLASGVACAAGGCLSLGGRTTYVQQSPENEARIKALETRVGALEQAFATRAAASPLNGSGIPMISRATAASPPYVRQDPASSSPGAR